MITLVFDFLDGRCEAQTADSGPARGDFIEDQDGNRHVVTDVTHRVIRAPGVVTRVAMLISLARVADPAEVCPGGGGE